jgi:hypothetical protein
LGDNAIKVAPGLASEISKYPDKATFIDAWNTQLKKWVPTDSSYKITSVPVSETNKYSELSKAQYPDTSGSVKYWTEKIKAGEPITPIVIEPMVKGTGYLIRDGVHRVIAADRAGVTNIPALVIETGKSAINRSFRDAAANELESVLGNLWQKVTK